MYLKKVTQLLFSQKGYETLYCLDECNHSQYKSHTEMVNKSIYALKVLCGKNNDQLRDKQLLRMQELLYNNYDLCKTCIFIFFPKFYYQYTHLPYIPTTSSHGIDVGHYAIVTYPNLSRFVYNKTYIWLWAVHNVFFSITTLISNPYHQASRSMLFEDFRRLVHHLILFKSKHWNIITFECKDFVIKLIEFIESELRMRTISHVIANAEWSNAILQMSLIFITKWLFYFNTKDTIGKNVERTKLIKLKIEHLKEKINSMSHGDNVDKRTMNFIRHFVLSFYNYVSWQNDIDRNMLNLWKIRLYNQECQASHCKRKRKHKKWYKCCLCLVAMYCSRKCAKRDWKYGYHKKYCSEYTEIRNDKEKYQEWIKDMDMDLGKRMW